MYIAKMERNLYTTIHNGDDNSVLNKLPETHTESLFFPFRNIDKRKTSK